MPRRGPHVTELFCLNGKVAMITGGAQNLGLDMAEALGEAGADLVITSRQPEKAERAAAELQSYLPVKVLPLGLDVTEEDGVAAAFGRVRAEYGRLDVLVCNAGGAKLTGEGITTDTFAVEDWDYVVRVNMRGTFLCCREALRLMKSDMERAADAASALSSPPLGRSWERGHPCPHPSGEAAGQHGPERAGMPALPAGGSIIIIASMSGMIGRDRWVYEGSPNMIPNMTVYSAAKSGLIGFMRDLAAENGRYGIRANCISPGGFERGQPEEFIGRYNKQTPLGRMGKDGTDLKGAVVYLASDASAYVTGHNLAVDGGFTAW